MFNKIAFYLCLIMVVGSLSLHNRITAQTPTPTPEPTPQVKGSISGIVTAKKSGNSIARAKVSLKSRQLNFKEKTRTDSNGKYEFLDLSAGNYTLKVKKSGFKSKKAKIELEEGENEVVDVQLRRQRTDDDDGNGNGGGGY